MTIVISLLMVRWNTYNKLNSPILFNQLYGHIQYDKLSVHAQFKMLNVDTQYDKLNDMVTMLLVSLIVTCNVISFIFTRNWFLFIIFFPASSRNNCWVGKKGHNFMYYIYNVLLYVNMFYFYLCHTQYKLV